jgi:hypothetical protein
VIVSRFQMLARWIGVAVVVLLACAARCNVAVKYAEPEDDGEEWSFEDDYFGPLSAPSG